MPRADQKQKLLYLKMILEEETDEAHPLNATQLAAMLNAQGISAERKSIYRDIEELRNFGMDILLLPGNSGGYYLASRTFEMPELKLLVDAVQSCKFLSERKSMELIQKLSQLTSRHEARSLRRQIFVSGRVKTMNESIYYNVDRLHEAIAQNSTIKFEYFDWGVDRQRHLRPGPYEASPYALCWSEENYYLIAHSARHGLTHYRVDKMLRIVRTGKPRYLPDNARELNLADYARKTFGMFHGESQMVRLRFHNSLAGVVIDRFGRDSMLIPDGPEHFTLTVEVAVSPLFFSWVMMLGEKAKIVYPQSVAGEFLARCQACAAQYRQDANGEAAQ